MGIIAGFVLENWRTSQVDYMYSVSELDLLDVKLQSEIYSLSDFNCEDAVMENIKFADRIYEEAKILDRYQQASRLTDKLVFEHKKYDILRTILLLNSIKIRNRCNASYYNVVYFYQFNNPDVDVKARESVFSKLLSELKDKKGEEVLLIPIAADNNITSVDLLLEKYDISKDELPIILVNEKIKIKDLLTIEDLEKYIK
jgi:hypothetical protein